MKNSSKTTYQFFNQLYLQYFIILEFKTYYFDQIDLKYTKNERHNIKMNISSSICIVDQQVILRIEYSLLVRYQQLHCFALSKEKKKRKTPNLRVAIGRSKVKIEYYIFSSNLYNLIHMEINCFIHIE